MALFILVTATIFTLSIVPTDVFTTVLVIWTALSFGMMIESTPKASHDLIIAPKLCGSSRWSNITTRGYSFSIFCMSSNGYVFTSSTSNIIP